jgi:hypothetical protein
MSALLRAGKFVFAKGNNMKLSVYDGTFKNGLLEGQGTPLRALLS